MHRLSNYDCKVAPSRFSITAAIALIMEYTRVAALLRIALLLVVAQSGWAADYYAAPDARLRARGSREDPFDLASALAATNTIRPGDTLWLLGGTYRGAFESKLQGSDDNPVTIRSAPGERATIDCRTIDGKDEAIFIVAGDWITVRDLEITCSKTKRATEKSGSHPSDVRRGGIRCRTSHVKFINLVIHDTGTALGFWSDGEGGEVYGCLIYNNGWQGPDRGHGHAIYSQNRRGVKRLVDNITFNQFGSGIDCYGTSKAFLNDFHIEGNFSFNNGCLTRTNKRSVNIHVGGGCQVRGATIVHNVAYSDKRSSGIRTGYQYGPSNADVVIKDNYVIGNVLITEFDEVTYTGNTIIGENTLLRLDLAGDQDPAKYSWDRNTYVSNEQRYRPFTLTREDDPKSRIFRDWREDTGVDVNSTYSESEPTGVKVFVRPNRYQQGRAHIAVVNWERRPEVEVDLSKVLNTGQSFRIVSAQNFYGEPILSGVYDGKLVQLPMKPVPAQRAVGLESRPPPVTEPEFGVFVVLAD